MGETWAKRYNKATTLYPEVVVEVKERMPLYHQGSTQFPRLLQLLSHIYQRFLKCPPAIE